VRAYDAGRHFASLRRYRSEARITHRCVFLPKMRVGRVSPSSPDFTLAVVPLVLRRARSIACTVSANMSSSPRSIARFHTLLT
jgi:hypothetical protein